jgi:type I restriction-modification system DNA methylase subunit
MAKKNFLESILKCLASIREQEAAERDILSAFADCRKAEAKLTAEQSFDSLKGWFILRACEKCKSKEEAEMYIKTLKVYLDNYLDKLQKNETIEETNKEILAMLYVSKQIKKEEEPQITPKLVS